MKKFRSRFERSRCFQTLRFLLVAWVLALGMGCSESGAHEHDATVDLDGALDASTHGDASSTTDAGVDAGSDSGADAGGDAGIETARVIVLSADGHLASLQITAPWTVRAMGDLDADVASARCRGMRCLVVHPAPTNTIDLIDARDVTVITTYDFAHGADPRDATFIDDNTAVVSQYGSADVVELNLTTKAMTPISLSALSDADGLPESLMLSSCGRRAYVQIRRVDHDTQAPSSLGAAIAVIDLDRVGADRVVDVDPNVVGVQGIALADRPDFDMPIDCQGGRLFVAEPKPLFSGGGVYELVDLTDFKAEEFPYATAQIGGFDVVTDTLVWRITHTDFGPGSSSHLELVGGVANDTHNTFSSYYVDDLALDRTEDLLFFPDPCTVSQANQQCQQGVHVFHGHTGYRAATDPIDVGFEPIEIVIAR